MNLSDSEMTLKSNATREPLLVSAESRGANHSPLLFTALTQRRAVRGQRIMAPRHSFFRVCEVRIARFISDNLQDELASEECLRLLAVINKLIEKLVMLAQKRRAVSHKGAVEDSAPRKAIGRRVFTYAPLLNRATLIPSAW